jgi:hypothetical protein
MVNDYKIDDSIRFSDLKNPSHPDFRVACASIKSIPHSQSIPITQWCIDLHIIAISTYPSGRWSFV